MPLACSRFSFTRLGAISHSGGCSLFLLENNHEKRTQPAKDLYQQITDQILEALEQGVMPWQKPWDSGWPQMAIPCNGESGRQYPGSTYFCFG